MTASTESSKELDMKFCENCGNKLNGNDTFCENCGYKNNYQETNIKSKNNTQWYFNIAIIILLVGFVGGIISGNVFEQKILIYESLADPEYNEYRTNFNWVIMLVTWISVTIFSIFIFGIGSVCHRLDLLINKTKKDTN